MTLRVAIGALCVALLLADSATAQPQVSGTWIVKGVSTKFTEVYAFWKDQAPFSADQHLYVLLSDVPLTDAQLPRNDAANGRLAELVRANRIHAFELHFSKPGHELSAGENGAVYHNGIQPARHGLVGFFEYQLVTIDGDWLEGRIRIDPEMKAVAPFSDITAQFRVRIPSKP
jgi:hypothetical protein